MSGMAAVWYRDGRDLEKDRLAEVSSALEHRGADREASWHCGSIGLVHHGCGVSGGSLLVDSHQGSCIVVTADVRLDNRNELTASLGLSAGARELSDVALIAAAYERWQEGCIDYLVGDFAFCIWDARRQVLFGARDHIGVKPFYYHYSARLAVAGSEIGAILALREVPRRLNLDRIADYLLPMLNDPDITFYRDVRRLAPAHCITISRTSVTIRRYWALDTVREIHRRRDAEYVEECREIFFEAVRCRLPDERPVGTFLSGGLDSSSITCAARDISLRNGCQPIHAFSLVFDLAPASDERGFISMVVDRSANIRSHLVAGDASGPLTDFRTTLPGEHEPYFAPNLFLHRAVYNAASANGVRVVLDGFDGDHAVGHGLARITELAARLRLVSAASEIRSISREFGKSSWQLTKERVIAPLVPAYAVKAARGLRLIREPASILSARLHQLAIDRQRRFAPPKATNARQEYLRNMSSGLIPFALEVADRAAATAGVEPRYPFFDKRFLEFCAALPSDQKMRDGWTRLVMRRAMNAVVPSQIQWRRGKADLGHNFTATLLRDGIPSLDSFDAVRPFLNGRRFTQSFARALHERRDSDVVALWRVTTLDAWLTAARLDATLS